MSDVFNNPSNDYVNPGLAPCANAGDDAEFKFIDDGAGVVVGSDIVQFMDLSDISIPVTSWTGEKKTLQSGEVTYVPGISRGLLYRTQLFDIPNFGYDKQEFFMMIDLSANYYYNFKNFDINIDASSSNDANIDIDDALNIVLSNTTLDISATYDPSSFTFKANNVGYDYDISNVSLRIIDASMDINSPFPSIIIDGVNIQQIYPLTENVDGMLPASKYPNGAMLGYMLKTLYPRDTCKYSSWLYMNHVDSPFEVYESIQVDNFIDDVSEYKSISFDPSIVYPVIVDDIAIDPSDAAFYNVDIISEPSIGINIVDCSLYGSYMYDASIINCSIYESGIGTSYTNKSLFEDSSIQNVSVISSHINKDSIVIDSSLENSWVNAFEVIPGLWTNDVSCERIYIEGGVIHDTSLNNTTISDASIYTSEIYDSSIINCTLYNTDLDDKTSLENCTTIYINGTMDASLSYTLDSSLYYERFMKIVDVGRNGCGDEKTMSASEYLDYINTHNMWFKVGPFSSRFTASDHPDYYTKNLIGGFYIFNPQTFPVQVEYMCLNYDE